MGGPKAPPVSPELIVGSEKFKRRSKDLMELHPNQPRWPHFHDLWRHRKVKQGQNCTNLQWRRVCHEKETWLPKLRRETMDIIDMTLEKSYEHISMTCDVTGGVSLDQSEWPMGEFLEPVVGSEKFKERWRGIMHTYSKQPCWPYLLDLWRHRKVKQGQTCTKSQWRTVSRGKQPDLLNWSKNRCLSLVRPHISDLDRYRWSVTSR